MSRAESTGEQFQKYFRKKWHSAIGLESGDATTVCTVRRWDGKILKFEPLSWTEMFDRTLAFCKKKKRPWHEREI